MENELADPELRALLAVLRLSGWTLRWQYARGFCVCTGPFEAQVYVDPDAAGSLTVCRTVCRWETNRSRILHEARYVTNTSGALELINSRVEKSANSA